MSITFSSIVCSLMAASVSIFVANPLAAQSYSPLYAPQSSISGQYQCLDQNNNPVPNASITMSTGAYVGTNAHFHGNSNSITEPISSVSPTSTTADGNGVWSVRLNTTLVGQAEVLLITCSNGAGTPQGSANYAVGYNDVYYNDHPNIWIKIGGTDTGKDTGHGSTAYNRYMQVTPPGIFNSGPAYWLYNATFSYFSNHPGISQVCTNDMALAFGGKFDINALNGQPWTSPHSAHDRGTAADVAGPGSGQCPSANQVIINDFLAACVANGAVAVNSINEFNHAHCQFASPSSFPH
jgi:hypothetical protein